VDSENPSRDEIEDIERVAQTSKQFLCICDCHFSYSITHTCFIAFIVLYSTYSLLFAFYSYCQFFSFK